MSSEESMSEASGSDPEESNSDTEPPQKRKILCRKPLPWRSRELNNVIASLDRKIARKKSQRSASMTIARRDGPVSNRLQPEDAPAFAVLN